MEQNEVVLRAIGILTRSAQWRRQAEAGDAGGDGPLGYGRGGGDPLGDDPGTGQIAALLAEVFPSVPVREEATALEAAHAVTEAALPAVMRLIGAFTYVFAELAEAHDSGRTDITSEQLLRELALRMSRAGDAV
ncbi:hypothetical protein [Streptomyces sp. NPDC095613]|uniref:hypothetical protein n=1 Tax=Streptomyces sp. NPDC095613 TaxID=3155540 RepID=UPI00331B5A71